VYDLQKTDWIEIDMPLSTQASLMRIFTQIKGYLPENAFYMGFEDTTMCFAADDVVN
jgi:hypothetical protein